MATIGQGLLKAGEAISGGLERRKKKARLADIVNNLQGLEGATMSGNLSGASSRLEDVINSVESIDELSDVLSIFKSVKSLSRPAGTPKERAVGALGRGATLPGLTADETRKLAGVGERQLKITPSDIKTLREELLPFGARLRGLALNLVPGVQPFEAELRGREQVIKDLRERQVEQFLGTKTATQTDKAKRPTFKIGQVIPRGDKKFKVVGFDTDGEPLVDEVQ